MPRGDKSKYSDKQIREAEHIAEGYQKRGKDEGWSKKVAWATVNKVKAAPAWARLLSKPVLPVDRAYHTDQKRRHCQLRAELRGTHTDPGICVDLC